MAEETELPPEEGTETIVAPPEGETEEQQADPVEALAREMGWAPKDQFRGDETEWKPAADFIKAGRDINRSISRELRGLKEQFGRVTSVTDQIIADKIAERDAYWQGKHAQAVEDGDHKAAATAVQEIVKLKAEAPKAPDPGMPPETEGFIERHKAWFGKDPLATTRAKQIAADLAKEGYDTAAQLAQVERAIKKEFPEHFPPPGKQPPGVQTAGSRNAGQGSSKKGFADLPPEARAIAQDMLARHGVPVEKYAERYFADQDKRRVG